MPELCGLALRKMGAYRRLLFPSDFSNFKWILSICSMYKRHHSSAEDCNFSCLFFSLFFARVEVEISRLIISEVPSPQGLLYQVSHAHYSPFKGDAPAHFLLRLVCTMISRSSLSFCTEGLYSLFLSRRILIERFSFIFHQFVIIGVCVIGCSIIN